MGLVRVEQLGRGFALAVEFWPFDLRPDLPPEGLPRDVAYSSTRLTPEYVQCLRQMAEEADIRLAVPPLVANTRKAHEATEFAKEQGAGHALSRAVFAAYWEEEENIGQIDTLCRLAQECGLDGQALRQALESGRYAQRVQEQMEWTRRQGIMGVPTIIFDGSYALKGAQSYDVFKSVAERILARRPGE
ncbi:MAG: DsbA family oxidoreductase [Dehalococcoidia bacterium]